MFRPLLSITVRHLLLLKRMNVLHSSTDIFSPSFKLVHGSLTFLGFFSFALSLSNFQKFSIGFKSGIWVGHFITVTSSSERNVLTDFAVWHEALSFMNTAGWLIAVLKLDTSFFNISLYTVALILPCILVRGPLYDQNHTKHHDTFYYKFNAAFRAWRQISFLRTASNKHSPVTTKEIKLWLIAEMNTLFFSPYGVFSAKFQSIHFVLFSKISLCRSYCSNLFH